MKVPILRVYLERSKGESATLFYAPEEVTDVHNMRISLGAEASKDTFSFDVFNHREVATDGTVSYTNSDSFKKTDKISIYAYYEDDFLGYKIDGFPDSSHLIISGFIKDIDYNVSRNDAKFKIQGTNKTDTAMNIMVPATFAEKTQNVSQIVINLVSKANATAGKGREITASLATGSVVNGVWTRTGGGYIWPNKQNGDSFPNVTYVKDYQYLINHLGKLAATDKTEDNISGTYLVYIDENNELHFEPKKLVADYTFDEYSDDVSILAKEDSTEGMVNVALVNAGQDPRGNGIMTLSYNLKSVAENGAKWKYYTEGDIAAAFQKKEEENSYNAGSINLDRFPSSYPWIVANTGSFEDSEWIAGTTTVANDSEYKDYIRGISRQIGKETGDLITSVFGNSRDSGKWEPELGTTVYRPNDLIDVQLYSIDYIKKLRVKTVSHSFNDGWMTEITLEEDEPKVTT